MADHSLLHVFAFTAVGAWVANYRFVPAEQKSMLWFFALAFLSLFLAADIAVLGVAAYLSAQNAYLDMVYAFESLVAYNTAYLSPDVNFITANLAWFESLLQFLVIGLALGLYNAVTYTAKGMVIPCLLLGLYLLLHCLGFVIVVAVSALCSKLFAILAAVSAFRIRVRRIWRKKKAEAVALLSFQVTAHQPHSVKDSHGTTNDNAAAAITSIDNALAHGETTAQVKDQHVHDGSDSKDKAQSEISEEDTAALGETDRDEAVSQVDTQETHGDIDSGEAPKNGESEEPDDTAEQMDQDDEATLQEDTEELHIDTSSSEWQPADESDSDSDSAEDDSPTPGEDDIRGPGEGVPKQWGFYQQPIWRVTHQAAYEDPYLLSELGMMQEDRWIFVHHTYSSYPTREAYDICVARYGTNGLREPSIPAENTAELAKEAPAAEPQPVPEDEEAHITEEETAKEGTSAAEPQTIPDDEPLHGDDEAEAERQAPEAEATKKNTPVAEPEHVPKTEQSAPHGYAQNVSEPQKADDENDMAPQPEVSVKEQQPTQDLAVIELAKLISDLELSSHEVFTSKDEASVKKKRLHDHSVADNVSESTANKDEHNSSPSTEAASAVEQTLTDHDTVESFSEAPQAIDQDSLTAEIGGPVEEARIEEQTPSPEHDVEEVAKDPPMVVEQDQPHTQAEVPVEQDSEVQLAPEAPGSTDHAAIGESPRLVSNDEYPLQVPPDLIIDDLDRDFGLTPAEIASSQRFDREHASLQQNSAISENNPDNERQTLSEDAERNGDLAAYTGGTTDAVGQVQLSPEATYPNAIDGLNGPLGNGENLLMVPHDLDHADIERSFEETAAELARNQTSPEVAGGRVDSAASTDGNADAAEPPTAIGDEAVFKAAGSSTNDEEVAPDYSADSGSVNMGSQAAIAAALNAQSAVPRIGNHFPGADTENSTSNFLQPLAPLNEFSESTSEQFTTAGLPTTAASNAKEQGDDGTNGYTTLGLFGGGFQADNVGNEDAFDDQVMTDLPPNGFTQGPEYQSGIPPMTPHPGAFTGFDPSGYQGAQAGNHMDVGNTNEAQQASTIQTSVGPPVVSTTRGSETVDTEMGDDSPIDVNMEDQPSESLPHDTANSTSTGNANQNGQSFAVTTQQQSLDRGSMIPPPISSWPNPSTSQGNVFSYAPAAPPQPAQSGGSGQGAQQFSPGLQQPIAGNSTLTQQGSILTPASGTQSTLTGNSSQVIHPQSAGLQQHGPSGSSGFVFNVISQKNPFASLGSNSLGSNSQGPPKASSSTSVQRKNGAPALLSGRKLPKNNFKRPINSAQETQETQSESKSSDEDSENAIAEFAPLPKEIRKALQVSANAAKSPAPIVQKTSADRGPKNSTSAPAESHQPMAGVKRPSPTTASFPSAQAPSSAPTSRPTPGAGTAYPSDGSRRLCPEDIPDEVLEIYDDAMGKHPHEEMSSKTPKAAESLACEWLIDSDQALDLEERVTSFTIKKIRDRLRAIATYFFDKSGDWDMNVVPEPELSSFPSECTEKIMLLDTKVKEIKKSREDLPATTTQLVFPAINDVIVLCAKFKFADAFEKDSDEYNPAKALKQAHMMVWAHRKKLEQQSWTQISKDQKVVAHLKTAADNMGRIKMEITNDRKKWDIMIFGPFGGRAEERAKGIEEVLRPVLEAQGDGEDLGHSAYPPWLHECLENCRLVIGSVDQINARK